MLTLDGIITEPELNLSLQRSIYYGVNFVKSIASWERNSCPTKWHIIIGVGKWVKRWDQVMSRP